MALPYSARLWISLVASPLVFTPAVGSLRVHFSSYQHSSSSSRVTCHQTSFHDTSITRGNAIPAVNLLFLVYNPQYATNKWPTLVYMCVSVLIYVCMYECVYVCIYLFVSMYVCISMYVRMYVCMYVCMYVWMYVYVCIISSTLILAAD